MKRIGITGAFGFLGANFISALLAAPKIALFPADKLEVVAFSSRIRNNPLFSPENVTIESLDILDRQDVFTKFQGLDAIAHFAGRVDYRRAYRREVWDTDVLGTKNVFDAALTAKVPRILYVSSISALGSGHEAGNSRADGMPDETRYANESSTPYGDPGWPSSFSSAAEVYAAIEASLSGDYCFLDKMQVAYFDAKLAGWELAKLYARDKGLPVVTIFPGTAVGAGDMHNAITKLVNNVWEGRLRFATSGATAFMDARDLGEGALCALSRGRRGEGYVIAGRDEHNLSYAEFIGLVAGLARSEGWHAQRRPLVLPRPLTLKIASIVERAIPKGSLTRALALSGSMRNTCTSKKAQTELQYKPRATLEEGILMCRRFMHS